MRALVFSLATFFLVSTISPAQSGGATPIGSTESDYNALHKLESESFRDHELIRISIISTAFEEMFRHRLTVEAIEAASDEDLGWIERATYLAAFYSLKSNYLDDLRRVVSELEERSIARDSQRVDLYRALIGNRRFDEARGYLLQHPNLDVEAVPGVLLPHSDVEDRLMAYHVDERRFRLSLQHLDVSRGTRVIAVSHPLCAFSRGAMEMVQSNPVIREALNGKAVWLAPVDMHLHFNEVQGWNREHPATPIFIARYREDWPMIEDWSTPNFYLLQDGRVVDNFSGWPKDGSNEKRLMQMLDRGRLLTTPQ